MNEASINDNDRYECQNCHLVQEFSDLLRIPDPPTCPRCGGENFEQITVSIVCDFCSTPATVDSQFWSYPAEDFEYSLQIEGIGFHGSKGEWACCEICHELIEEDDRKGLALRSVEKDIERDPDYHGHQDFLMKIAVSMHNDFFTHRTGPAREEQM